MSIDNNFRYHKPTEVKAGQHETVRESLRVVSHLIDQTCPESKEKALALMKLEEAMMWANAAIARN